MKKTLLFIFICICIILCFACSSETNKQKTDIMRVSIVFPHADDEYWSVIEDSIKYHSDELTNNSINIKFLVPQINYNINQMTEILKQQIAAKVDVIVIQGNDDKDYLNAFFYGV